MTQELVSIIIPVYNIEKYVAKCIDSIINQTYKNIEIIIVDDGSKDNSPQIIDKYSNLDTRIKVIHQKNGGVSVARNTGIEKSTGNYICFVDGDDYIMPNYIEYLYNLITKNKADIASSSEFFSNFNTKQITRHKIKIFNSTDALKNVLEYNIPVYLHSKIYSKNILKNNLKFDTTIKIGEDFYFNVCAIKNAKKIVVGNQKVYFYRRDNENSLTTKFNKQKWETGLYALQLIKDKIDTNNKTLLNAWKFANWRTYTDAYDKLVLSNTIKQNNQFYNKCISLIKKDALLALKTTTSAKQKIRAVIFKINPKIIPKILILRSKKYLKN